MPNHYGFEGRVALVTGGASGIGAATAARLREGGAEVHVFDLANGQDVRDAAAVRAVVDALPRLDVLVCAAGTNVPQPLDAIDLETADRLWALNVRAGLHAAQLAVRRMPPSGGAIVFVSSQMGHVGAPRRSVYCATKHAVEGLTKALAVELAPRGIRVVSIAPTFVATELTRPFLEAEGEEIVQRIPLGRLATLEEVAAAAVFAATTGAVTGCSVMVDGGWTAQ